MDTITQIELLNDKLSRLNNEYKISSHMNNFEQQISLRNDNNLRDLIKNDLNESNAINDKMNSFLIDKSIYKTNNDYYKTDNKIPTNTVNYTTDNYNENTETNIEEHTEENMNEDMNNRLEKLQFHNMSDYIIKNSDYCDNNNIDDNNTVNTSNNLKYNKISPFESSNINVVRKKNADLTNARLNNFAPLGRSMISAHNIQYELNENFNNNRYKNKKEIGNDRLSEFTPLSRTQQIPVKNNPVKSDATRTFLECENTFSQSNLNTNYKTKK
jgi:hypothetical protein